MGPNKAIILCGGKGTRLKPFTYVLPKPLVPVGEKPILLLLIERLRLHGITELVFCANYMADLLSSYFGDGSRYGVSITYSLEDQPLGTVAPIKRVPGLPADFLVMNGDLLTDLDFTRFWNHHLESGALLTVGTYSRQVQIDFGVMEIQDSRVTAFHEKPTHRFDVSMGIYAFNRAVLEHVPEGRPFGFDNLVLKLLEKSVPISVYPHRGYWLDIGRLEDFEKANEDVWKMESCRPQLSSPNHDDH
jgi:NDP-mannose synthase